MFLSPDLLFAILLNDLADDEDRQRLLPYVARLACADTPEVEKARAAYISRRMGRCYVELHLLGVVVLSFDRSLRVLEGALAIGRQADPLGAEVVQSRMDAARTPRSKSFSKVKSWLSMRETEPAA